MAVLQPKFVWQIFIKNSLQSAVFDIYTGGFSEDDVFVVLVLKLFRAKIECSFDFCYRTAKIFCYGRGSWQRGGTGT